MPRPIDPQRHRARRLQIIDAGLTVFARRGYAGATTAAICREAGIGSGTFFHYFPTKLSLVLAILDEGVTESREFFAAHEEHSEPVRVVFDWVRHELRDLSDPRASGFIAVVSGLVAHEEISAALAAQDEINRAGLVACVESAQESGQIRGDVTAGRLAEWVMVVVDGFAGRVGSAGAFDVETEQPLLFETISTLLTGPGKDNG